MKTKSLIVLMGLLLLNSCIVKSLNPFYTKDKIHYDKSIVGNWNGSSGDWNIMSLEERIKEDARKNKKEDSLNEDVKLSKEDHKLIKKYEQSYVVEISKNDKDAMFIATPFKVDEHLFLNFTLIEYGTDELNGLAAQHLLSTHSACLVEYEGKNKVRLKWLDEKIVKSLLEANALKIKHERTGIEEDELILTASSTELYRFLEKFMSSTIDDKWEKDQIYTLNRVDVKS